MSYGFEARNAAGELVIDDFSPVYILGSATTVTGTQFGSQPWYSFTRPSSNTLRFWQLSVGDGIAAYPNGFMGSKSSFTVRDIIRVPLAAAPTGYGFVVYDASGNRVYQSSSDMITIGDKYTVTTNGFLTGGTTVSTSDQWVALESWQYSIRPADPIFGIALAGGAYRDSSTTYTAYAPIFSNAPGGYTDLNPTTFITAK